MQNKFLPKDQAEALRFLVVGPLMALLSAWYLGTHSAALLAPTEVGDFPRVYALLVSFVLSGLFFSASGGAWFLRATPAKSAEPARASRRRL
ncbi:MAG TPA: hypothetical protein VFS43_14330 [Polyangiaceae bacterium]|nr:hypothetical protein [Polyangiaceae bacterium]